MYKKFKALIIIVIFLASVAALRFYQGDKAEIKRTVSQASITKNTQQTKIPTTSSGALISSTISAANSPLQSTNILTSPAIQDKYSYTPPLEERKSPLSKNGTRQRERLINSGGKYPFIRVVDTLSTDPTSGKEIISFQTAMVADHVIVRIKNGYSHASIESYAKQHGFSIRKTMEAPDCFLVAAKPPTLDTITLLTNSLAHADCIDIVEPDYMVQVSDTEPNDPSYSLLWGMKKIKMPKVWDMTTGSNEAVVAIFDTGTDLSHEDLRDNLWVNPGEIAGNNIDDDNNGYIDDVYGWDFYSDDNDPSDVYGHGSHVAGTIGAKGNNFKGVAGVNWNIKIMTIKFFGYDPTGHLEGFASDAMDGMYYVITQKTRGVPVRVTNNSWGGSSFSSLLKDSFEIAGGQGIMHVVAAGNNGNLNNDTNPQYPASFNLSNIVAVANTTSSDGLSSSSHYGATSVDIGAPGTSIYSISRGGGYIYMTGTSMASPHVAGVAALMFAYMPNLTWQKVRTAIIDGADPLSSLSGKCVSGGRLDAYGAFKNIAPIIGHEPLDNTTNVGSDYTIKAIIKPSIPFIDTNKVAVLWNTTGNTNSFSTNILYHISGDLFQGIIPAQSKGTEIYYMITATTKTGLSVTDPADAPTSLHSFDVTTPVDLLVYGLPTEYETVVPEYGKNTEPYGKTVTATASSYTQPTNNQRFRCNGWYGGGNVPPIGSSNSVSFIIDRTSAIAWNWIEQRPLIQSSLITNAVNTTSWWDINTKASTVTAPSTISSNSNDYAFICWQIDGQRSPDATNTAVNPVTNLTMNSEHMAEAIYLPLNEDTDSDGLPDWWEMYNFANLNSGPDDDPDNDGFSNSAELSDNSNPRDPASIPTGPSIVHVPLPNCVGTLSPWALSAIVKDSSGIDSVELSWQRNSQPWQSSPMENSSGDTYNGTIPSPHALGDNYTYYITATDSAMNTSTTTVYSFTVAYPQIAVIANTLSVEIEPKTTLSIPITITNSGNATLTWQIQTNWSDSITGKTNGWTHSGQYDFWHITRQEAHSEKYSWYNGNEQLGSYENLTDASLITPAVTLGANPTFSFWQWAKFEYDGSAGYENYFWDGAVIDISTNDGASFDRIAPVGGYPYKITPNPDSPFEPDTPCLAGTGGWEKVVFDLKDYAGKNVKVRFRFGSDRYSVERGWYIDDPVFSWESTWMTISTTSGNVEPQSSGLLSVDVDSSLLDIGTYNNAISINSNDPTQPNVDVPIILHVLIEDNDAHIAVDTNNPNAFIITWPADTYHNYTLLSNTNLTTTNWFGVPEYIDIPGINGIMGYTGALDAASTIFYRVEEKP